jgi:hypothetical protein
MNVESVRQKYEETLMGLPNVIGLGIGEKAGKEVIKVFVTRKVPESALQTKEIIPATLEGWDVDVEEIGTVTAQE